jgi:hypothetical protein
LIDPIDIYVIYMARGRDKRKYNNTLKTSLRLRGRCCAGDKNQTGPSKYNPEVKARGREVWIGNKPK